MEIDTSDFSKVMRKKILNQEEKKIRITNFKNTIQSKDEYTRVNCSGFGRIRKFEKFSFFFNDGDSSKPLFRGYQKKLPFESQVFQMAGCNWRCWHCFVDDNVLSAHKNVTKLLSTDELIELYLKEEKQLDILDLSGGQPDLVPEWTLWFLKSIEKYNLKNKVFVWIDDNLSTFYFKKYLSLSEIKYIATFPKLSKVGSFKGYDEASFSFNTGSHPSGYKKQFDIFKELLSFKFDMYAYVTFTAIPECKDITRSKLRIFINDLQEIHFNLPLKIIPLKIHEFNAFESRKHIDFNTQEVLLFQELVYQIWREELKKVYSYSELELAYENINIKDEIDE